MQAKTYLPPRDLAPYIKSYSFILINNASRTHPIQFLLPDGSFEIIFQLSGKIDQLYTNKGSWLIQPNSSLGGLFDVHYKFKPVGICCFLRIKFLAGKMNFFDLGELSRIQNRMVEIKSLNYLSHVKNPEQFKSNQFQTSMLEKMNHYFESRLSPNPAVEDPKISMAIKRIVESKGLIRIEGLALQSKLSLSGFRRKFKEQVGTSPKRFARLQRINHVSRIIDQDEKVNLTTLAHEMHYFDQSHFIKDVRNVCGVAPSQLRLRAFSLQHALASS